MGDGRIEPEAIPGRGLDGPAVRGVAVTLRSRAVAVRQISGQASTGWSVLQTAIRGEGLEPVWTGLDKPLGVLSGVVDRFDAAAGVLEKFAEAADVLSVQYKSLYADAVGFRGWIDPGVLMPVNETRVVGDVVIMEQVGEAPAYWKESGEALAQNSALMRRVDVLAAAVSQAEADCVNGLNGLRNVCVPQATGFTAEDLDYVAEWGDEGLPWGGIVHGSGDILQSWGSELKEFGWSLLGIASFVGFDPESGWDWSLGTAGQSWWGLVKVVGALGGEAFLGLPAALPGGPGWTDRAVDWSRRTLAPVSDDLVAAGRWDKDPAGASMHVLLNVVSFVVPGTGVAKGLRGAKLAAGARVGLEALSGTAKTARAAEVLSKAAVVAGKAEDLFNLPSKLAGKALEGLTGRFKNVDLGDLGELGRTGRVASDDPALYPRPKVADPAHVHTVEKGDVPGTEAFAARTGLEPNAVYHVQGRGEFYTNADGKVTYVKTTWADDPKLPNPDLMDPQAGVTYVVTPRVKNPVEGLNYDQVLVVSEDKLTVTFYAEHLAPGDAVRNTTVQVKAGGPDSAYEGGHMAPAADGGGYEFINYTQQHFLANRGPGELSFKNQDEFFRQLTAGDPRAVEHVTITATYPEGAAPTSTTYTPRGGDTYTGSINPKPESYKVEWYEGTVKKKQLIPNDEAGWIKATEDLKASRGEK